MPDIRITETLTVNEREITEEERYVSHLYNQLVTDALHYARHQLRVGSQSTKLTITKSVISAASRLAALDSKTSTEEHRIAFQALLDTVKQVPAVTAEPLTHDSIITPISRAVIDQDKIDRD